MHNWVKFNIHFLVSGFIILFLVYLYSFYFRIPFYYFFLLPTIVIYILGMNILFALIMVAEKNATISTKLKWDPLIAKEKKAKLLRNVAYSINLLMGVLLVLFMTFY